MIKTSLVCFCVMDKNPAFSFNNFISTAKRTQERGDPIVPALLSQIDDIYKKVEIDKRSYIANQDNIFSSLQIPLCMMPALLAFMIPMFLSAFRALSMF